MGGLQKHCTTAPPDLARLQVGTYACLKNFRKGLKHQRERCFRELAAATDAGDAATAADCNGRLRWIHEKQAFLDTRNEMVTDMPVMRNGRQREYGSLEPAARRRLTNEEIRWNAEMIRNEGATPATPAAATAPTRGSASAPAPATPAAATAPTRGSASAPTPATPAAGSASAPTPATPAAATAPTPQWQ